MSGGRKVLVTGAGGYVGAALAVDLDRRGWAVVGYGHGTNFPALAARLGGSAELVEGDLGDPAGLARAMRGADAVVHAASFAGERSCRRDMPGAVKSIVRGTRHVVDAVARNGAPRLVHLSTYAVYSTFRERPMPLREDDELTPDDLYGTLKAEAEWEASRVPAAILRLTNVFGPGAGIVLKTDVLGHFTRAVREGKPLKMNAGGRQGIEFVHVDDVCRVVAELLEGPRLAAPLALNVGVGRSTPIRELAALFQRVARESLGREIEIVSEESGEIWPDRWVSIERLRARFPWYPAKSLEDGVRELLTARPAEPRV
jgi:nucleoside-diphosphate-sugar epimerase